MSKTYSLTLGERLATLRILDGFKGTTSALAAVLEDIKPLAITDAEWKTAELVKTKSLNADKQEVETWNWKEEGSEKKIELQQPTVDYILAQIKSKSDANEITIADIALISVEKKLK